MGRMEILIVEDDENLGEGLSYSLETEGYQTFLAQTVKSALKLLQGSHVFDLILLDCNLPDGDGFEFCRRIRRESQVPILMLTARDMEIDEVKGLEAGADDYVTKPFSLSVLKARVSALLRRKTLGRETNELVSNEIRLDVDHHKAYKQDEELNLSNIEYQLLHYLMINKGQLLLKEQIMEYLWGSNLKFVDDNAVSVNIRRLRVKIEKDPSNPVYISTVYGMGYLWSEVME